MRVSLKMNPSSVASPAYLEQIFQEDWEKTPASVQKLVEEMAQRIEQLEQQLAEVLAVQQQPLSFSVA